MAKDKKKKDVAKGHVKPAVEPRLEVLFRDQVAGKIAEQFEIKNKLALPKLDKIVITVGLGKQLEGTKLNPKAKEQVLQDLGLITGQQPVMTKAKKSVSNFKVRSGYENGAMVTLRGEIMWEFLDRLINLAIPRIKDFRGLPTKSFDGRGGYAFGVGEQGIFPEVDMAHAQFTFGMNINFCFSSSTDEISRAVLEQLGFPFRKPEEKKAKAA